MEECDGAGQVTIGNIIRRMRFACWITTATDTHSQRVIVIAFPRQEWLRERASDLRNNYIKCLILVFFSSHFRYLLKYYLKSGHDHFHVRYN